MRTRRPDADRKAAAEAVAACVHDDDGEVHNLTEAAVRKNPLTAALNLTALAAAAVAELAIARRVPPEQVLRSLAAAAFDVADHDLRPQHGVQGVNPASMDDYDWAMTEAKGWIEIAIRSTDGEQAITFYDPVRLAQEVETAMNGPGYFAESTIVIVPAVTREAIEAVIRRMARSGFAHLG